MASFWRRYGVIILALAAIAAVSMVLLGVRGRPLDIALFWAINGGADGPVLDALAWAGYALGSFWFSLALFAAFYLAGHRRFGLSALGAMLVGALLVLLIKLLSQQPRPWQALPEVRVVGLRAAGPAFPSGHAEQAWLTACLLASYFLFNWYRQVGLYSLAALVGLSRIYVGDHLPSDVVAGALVGILCGVLWMQTRLWLGVRGRAP